MIEESGEPGEDFSVIEGLTRVLEGGRTALDDEFGICNEEEMKLQPARADEKDQELATAHSRPLTLMHFVTHLPKDPKRCRACCLAKAAKSHARRRPLSAVTVRSKDAEEFPFGACVHMDHIIMKFCSTAASTARVALMMTDEDRLPGMCSRESENRG